MASSHSHREPRFLRQETRCNSELCLWARAQRDGRRSGPAREEGVQRQCFVECRIDVTIDLIIIFVLVVLTVVCMFAGFALLPIAENASAGPEWSIMLGAASVLFIFLAILLTGKAQRRREKFAIRNLPWCSFEVDPEDASGSLWKLSFRLLVLLTIVTLWLGSKVDRVFFQSRGYGYPVMGAVCYLAILAEKLRMKKRSNSIVDHNEQAGPRNE